MEIDKVSCLRSRMTHLIERKCFEIIEHTAPFTESKMLMRL